MPISVITSAFIAVLVGFAGSVPVVAAALHAVSATPAQMASGIAAVCLGVAVTTLYLSIRYRKPLVTAWTFPGSAVIAASNGIGFEAAMGACVFAGVLLMLTGASSWLSALVKRLPIPIAAGTLAGLLFGIVTPMFPFVETDPVQGLGVLIVYFVVRVFSATWAVVAGLVTGVLLAYMLNGVVMPQTFPMTEFVFVTPRFEFSAIIGIGLPLYLVTMVSQNLTGFAVLKASSYDDIPTQTIVLSTGFVSVLTAPFGALSINLAAITAAVCTGKDCHPDVDQRWKSGIFYAFGYAVLAAFTGAFLNLFNSFPPALIVSIAGIALLGPLMNALIQSVSEPQLHLPAVTAFVVTASGVGFMGIGAPFWGLCAGLCIMAVQLALAKFVNTH